MVAEKTCPVCKDVIYATQEYLRIQNGYCGDCFSLVEASKTSNEALMAVHLIERLSRYSTMQRETAIDTVRQAYDLFRLRQTALDMVSEKEEE